MKDLSKYNRKIELMDTDDYESPFRLYDKIQDITLFNTIDQEQIKLGGSPLWVYKYYQSTDYDPVYGEDRSKTIAVEPIKLFGLYEPRAIEENLTQFGIEIINDQQFTFNRSYIERKLGRALIPGDIIKPDFEHIKYEVYEVQESGFEGYGVYHLICSARILRDDKEIHKIELNTHTDVKSQIVLPEDDDQYNQ
jgi:hypothetical protein